ncbi:hypothetical protein [Methylopila sp. M107]|uniref:hypothetical protein n=1 Tax=Methylopila sp. M107 TaxID=1101190 RepID=UPI0003655C51|nr:hypothetical protein [Methylopila sp. M107]
MSQPFQLSAILAERAQLLEAAKESTAASSAPSRTRTDASNSVLAALAAVMVVAATALHLVWPLPADTSWLLTVCERMLAGQTLYADITELNPPMSPWLYMPWVWLAPKIGVPADILAVLATIGVCLVATALSERILTAAGLIRSREVWRLVAIFALLVAPVLTFSQREHFAVAFALPMLAAIAARAGGRPLSTGLLLVAGLCGGLTMAVKPHFGLAILLAVMCAVAARRSLRPVFAPENLLAGAVFALYAGLVVLLHPEYFTEMLPIAGAIYVPNRVPLATLLQLPLPILLYLSLGAWLAKDGLGDTPFPKILLAATVGFFVAYLVQGRGWTYHLLPAGVLGTIGFGLAVFDAERGRAHALPRRVLASSLAIVAAGLLALMTVMNVVERERDELPFLEKLAAALEPLGPHPKIALISEDITVGSPFHRMIGATLINRGPSLWMAGNAFRLCAKDKSDAAKTKCDRAIADERAMLREDLKRNPPDVVLAAKHGRDWLAFAREDEETASLLDAYRSYGTVEDGEFKVEILVPKSFAELQLRPSLVAAGAR